MSSEHAREWVKETVAALYNSEYARERVAMENHLTLPVPRVRGTAQEVLFSFCVKDAAVADGPNKIYPPFLTAEVKYPERDITWREVTPGDYGLGRSAQTPLGTLDDLGQLMLELTPRGYRERRERYYALLSVVFSEGWLFGGGRPEGRAHDVARELEQLFGKISEAALRDYYRAAGRDFVAWLSSASAP
jgi:hypothetical protein